VEDLELTEEVERRLREQLRTIKRNWPNAKSLNPKAVALSGLLSEGYHLYSQLSSDAGHPSLTSLKRYVSRPSEITAEVDFEINVVPTPTDEEIQTTWDWACNAMLGTCTGVNEILGGTPAGMRLKETADRYQSLTTRRNACFKHPNSRR
jgi:hypothetical protein